MGKSKITHIPFNPKGEHLTYTDLKYPETCRDDGKISEFWLNRYRPSEWKENHVFSAKLVFKEFERGRSAAHALFHDEDGKRYTMFLTDLHDAIPFMVRGKITGNFTFIKRGQNYGVRFVKGV